MATGTTVTQTTPTEEVSVGIAVNDYLLEMTHGYDAASRELYTHEDALFEMLEELPSDEQIVTLTAHLRTTTLRNMTADLLKYNVAVAKNHGLYPYAFVERLSSWVASAQEIVASKKGVRQVLRDRDEMRRNDLNQ